MLATKETLSHGYAILYLVFVIIISFFDIVWASLVAQMVKNPPAIQETWVPSLGWEDPLEDLGKPLRYSCLENPHGQRSQVGYSPWGLKESHMTE